MEKIKAKTKGLFDTARSGEPVSKFTSNKVAAETYWPKALDKEADKAACILRTFFIDGYIVPYKTLNRVPNEVLRHCKGVAVFTVLRNGLHWSGAAGSGIIVARRSNGQWSAPASTLIHTSGWNFPDGGDVYDCVCVINEDNAMQAMSKLTFTFGDKISFGPGPFGGSMNDVEIKTPHAPVCIYVESKGHAIDAQMKGTTIVERTSENERFYGVDEISNAKILAGEVQAPTGPASQLLEVLEAVEQNNHNSNKLPSPTKSPGYYVLEAPKEGSQREFDEIQHHAGERMDS